VCLSLTLSHLFLAFDIAAINRSIGYLENL
jgi:hypothetical protein